MKRFWSFPLEYHEWLLSESVDLLPRLLLPLAGPEEFDEDDTEKLPDDLQYLGDDKKREPEAEIRLMLVETVNKVWLIMRYSADLNFRVYDKQYVISWHVLQYFCCLLMSDTGAQNPSQVGFWPVFSHILQFVLSKYLFFTEFKYPLLSEVMVIWLQLSWEVIKCKTIWI